jgi:hypothetical protein
MYSIFIAPIFDIENLHAVTDNLFMPRWKASLSNLILEMEKSVEPITKWLRKSGLKVNDGKTELCLLNRMDLAWK